MFCVPNFYFIDHPQRDTKRQRHSGNGYGSLPVPSHYSVCGCSSRGLGMFLRILWFKWFTNDLVDKRQGRRKSNARHASFCHRVLKFRPKHRQTHRQQRPSTTNSYHSAVLGCYQWYLLPMKVYVGCEGGGGGGTVVVPVNKQVQAQVMDIGGWWTTPWSGLPCPGLYTTNDYMWTQCWFCCHRRRCCCW